MWLDLVLLLRWLQIFLLTYFYGLFVCLFVLIEHTLPDLTGKRRFSWTHRADIPPVGYQRIPEIFRINTAGGFPLKYPAGMCVWEGVGT